MYKTREFITTTGKEKKQNLQKRILLLPKSRKQTNELSQYESKVKMKSKITELTT